MSFTCISRHKGYSRMNVFINVHTSVANRMSRNIVDFNYTHTTMIAMMPDTMFKIKLSLMMASSDSNKKLSADIESMSN
eukprot:CAMPEP_0116981984 /NCGR_PEP_ID=MMETSP0467-20121206/60059_1 /TAXON_ID=283647 /ORGANISM="Mesodinium pulex, Strain SPMC105" /LENGTH=78 /DNA_ID=CAMNT_0004676363 /DNA_START=2259 /DNA_END=2495 /DNA_ORIENTATION=+